MICTSAQEGNPAIGLPRQWVPECGIDEAVVSLEVASAAARTCNIQTTVSAAGFGR